MKKIIVRIKGGLGNQLFCYAAAKRLAIMNDAELVIDNYNGFSRDFEYKRSNKLNHFNISSRNANKFELFLSLNRYWLIFLKLVSKYRIYSNKYYIEQQGMDFDIRLLTLKFNKSLYLDGYWQSESYFEDIAHIIRNEFKIITPIDLTNINLASEISSRNSVCVHIRWFDDPESICSHNVSKEYYNNAIKEIERKLSNAYYYVFSDKPEVIKRILNISKGKYSIISHNTSDENSHLDLWLMTKCKHFIIANSTFSWWGAWLSDEKDKIVITPNLKLEGKTAWGFKGLIPKKWEKI